MKKTCLLLAAAALIICGCAPAPRGGGYRVEVLSEYVEGRQPAAPGNGAGKEAAEEPSAQEPAEKPAVEEPVVEEPAQRMRREHVPLL